MERKGGSRSLAEDLRQKEQHKYLTKLEERKAAAEKRMQDLVKLDESKKKEKDDIMAGKGKLRKVQDLDAQAKQQHRDGVSKLTTKDDFKDHNVLSYIFEVKLHKSYEYDKKKEANIRKIMETFPTEDKIMQFHNKKEHGTNQTDGPSREAQEKRKADQKKKEMEAKFFQDMQVQEKNAKRQAEKEQQLADYQRVMKEVESFQQEEAQKK